MSTRIQWTRQQLLVALALYCHTPFSKMQSKNTEIIRIANAIGRTPSALGMKLGNFASLDPEIIATGRSGLQNASAKDRAMWDEMQNDWESFAVESHRAMEDVEAAAEPIEITIEDKNIDDRIGKDRLIETTARIGQDFFRSVLLSTYEGRCCITGLSVPVLLVASHIVPWRYDACNRVNPRNGLLLSSLHDKAFDIGLITIDDNMTVRVSRTEKEKDDRFFSAAIEKYDGQPIRPPVKYQPGREFLAYHREYIFLG